MPCGSEAFSHIGKEKMALFKCLKIDCLIIILKNTCVEFPFFKCQDNNL
jgi:hypothetical protein